jgi:hypothetical protein
VSATDALNLAIQGDLPTFMEESLRGVAIFTDQNIKEWSLVSPSLKILET